MSPALSEDLYRVIMRYTSSRHDLYTLSITSKALQVDAEFYLYRHLESSQWTRTEELCDLIIHCPRFHPLVRSLSITNEGPKFVLSLEYWNHIAELLMNLPNLESLKIYDGISVVNRNAWVLSRCISSLRRIEMDFELDDHLICFFQKQHRLRQIYWLNSSREDVSVAVTQSLAQQPTNFLSSVTELMTNCPPFALHLVNTHGLSHLWLCGPAREEQEGSEWMQYFSGFGRNAENLSSLRMNFPLGRRTCITALAELAKHAPRLRSIGFVPYFDAKNKELLSVLAEFKQLRSLVTWSVISSDTSRLLARCCPSLRLVACLHYSYSHEYVYLPVNPLGTPKPVHDPDFTLWRDVDLTLSRI